MSSRTIGMLTACVAIAVAADAQSVWPRRPPLEAGTAGISGRVTDDLGVPIEGAEVTASERGRDRDRLSSTGADGSYRFDRIPDGQYAVQARRKGYAAFWVADGATLPPFVAMTSVVQDQFRGEVNLVLPREGRIRGRVIDQAGKPVAGVSVGAGRIVRDKFVRQTPTVLRVDGQQKLIEADGLTGADGAYEIAGLPPGDLLVEARPPIVRALRGAAADGVDESPTVQYEPGFHPAVASPELASAVRVQVGRVTEGVDVVLNGLEVSTLRMRIGPEPQTLTSLQINVVAFPGKQIRSVMISDDGLAQVQRLKEGAYAVWARARDDGNAVAAFRMIDFRAGMPEMALPLEAAGRIAGRVIAARGGLPPIDGMRVTSALSFDGEPVDHLAVDAVDVGADGRFILEGQFGARRVSVSALPVGWELREIRHGRQDITQAGVEVPPGATIDIEIVVDRR